MRVRIKQHGHQHFQEFVGELLHVGTGITTEGTVMTVPVAVIRTDGGSIETVPLQEALRWVEIKTMDEPVAPDSKPPWFAEALNRRAEIELLLLDAAAGKRPLPTREECRAWALKLGTPKEYQA